MMTNLDNRWQLATLQVGAQLDLKPEPKVYNAAVLRGVSSRSQKVQTGRHPAGHDVKERLHKRFLAPGRRNDIDIVKIMRTIDECRLQRVYGKRLRVLFTIEPLFFQDHEWLAVLQQSQSRVMRL